MERENHCRDCGFDLGKVEMSVLYAGKGVAGARRKLYCPICRGGPIEIEAERVAFPRADGAWVRWRESASVGRPDVIAVGRLRLRIDARVDTLSAEQACFRAVPMFVSNGVRTVPALPVRPEFLDCIDPVQLARAQSQPERFGKVVQEGNRTRYRSVVPLRGLRENEWPTVECDVLSAAPEANPSDTDALAFRGVSLQVWPNLKRPTPEWKYYAVSVRAAAEEGLKLFAGGRRFRARMFVPRGRDGESVTSFVEVPIDQEVGREGDGDPTGFVGVATGRPAWISLEWNRAAAAGEHEPLGGGLFALAPANAEAQLRGELSLGIDFGTSNTVVSVRRADGTVECVAPETRRQRDRTTLYLVHGGPETLRRGLDLWPGGSWAGAHHDLIPSELGCSRRWSDVASRDGIEALTFGRDFGIPLRGTRGAASPEHVVGEFKWLRAVQKEKSALARQDIVEALQARFLEAAVLMTMGALLAETETAARTVTIYYSYPLAFEDHDLQTLERATAATERRLKLLTGADVKFIELMDEAQAASVGHGANKMFRVSVDLGGGSLEVLVDDTWARNGRFGHEGLHPHVFSTSLFFGGSVFLRSLTGGGEGDRRGACVMPAVTSYTTLASEVRTWESGRRLLESPEIIAEARKATVVRRARVFFGYIAELVARALAGVCLEHGRTREGAIDLSRNRMFTLSTAGGSKRWVLGTPGEDGLRKIEFSLILLGNGWGFADIVRDGKGTVEEMVAQRVRIRLGELLRETPIARQITDGTSSLADALDDDSHAQLGLAVTFEPEGAVHRKSRIARGLLESQDRQQGSLRHETRANGRHGVLGFDMRVVDAGRDVQWYRPFGPPARDRPELMQAQGEGSPRATVEPVTRAESPPVATMAHTAPIKTAVHSGVVPGAMLPQAPMTGAGPLESAVWMLAQQWPQVTAAAAQHGLSPHDFAGRQLWGSVIQTATQTQQTPEHCLAMQRWEQVRQSVAMPGTPIEALTPLWQQQWQEIVANAVRGGMTPDAYLAAQRWEQLIALLARSAPADFGALPPPPPFPTEPRGSR